ncbi:hypothetical protein K0M31_008329, partial [Melipona bicolor]
NMGMRVTDAKPHESIVLKNSRYERTMFSARSLVPRESAHNAIEEPTISHKNMSSCLHLHLARCSSEISHPNKFNLNQVHSTQTNHIPTTSCLDADVYAKFLQKNFKSSSPTTAIPFNSNSSLPKDLNNPNNPNMCQKL